MTDLFAAFGLMLVIEGALYALFPVMMQDLMSQLRNLPPQQLRMAGLLAAGLGFVLVAAVRGVPH